MSDNAPDVLTLAAYFAAALVALGWVCDDVICDWFIRRDERRAPR